MKGYERRAAGKPNYFKLATWDAGRCCWNDGKRQYDTEELAREAASAPGRYRLSEVIDGKGRKDGLPFEVGCHAG